MHRDGKLHPSITKSRMELNAMSLHTACFVINAEIFVKSTKRIYGRKQKDSSTSYFLSSEIVSLAYNSPLVYIGTFPTFQIKCHVRNILYIKRTTSMVSRAICKYYLINSTKVDRLKTLHLCSRWERPGECMCVCWVNVSLHYAKVSSVCLSQIFAYQNKDHTDKLIMTGSDLGLWFKWLS